jgi:surface polysaccharide O-acyltransferase-like enzyme
LFVKLGAGMFFDLENPVNLESIHTILINPYRSYIPPLWYVHALFIIFVAYPLLRSWFSDFSLLLLFTFLNIILDSDVTLYGKALHNIPFFITGIIFRSSKIVLARWLDGSASVILLLSSFFVVSCYALKKYFHRDSPGEYPIVFIAGVCGTLLTIILSRKIAKADAPGIRFILTATGIYSMSIYLFHTLFESAMRIVLMQTFRELKIFFELVLLISVVSGLIFPLILEKYFLRKNKITRKFILGLP